MRKRVLAAGAATAILIPTLVACGSADTKTEPASTPSASSAAATDNSAATAAGLTNMVGLAKRIAAAEGAAGTKLAEGLEGFWAPIEDGIKAKDPNTYTAVEDAMAGLESGDKAKATQAATDLETAVTTYLAK